MAGPGFGSGGSGGRGGALRGMKQGPETGEAEPMCRHPKDDADEGERSCRVCAGALTAARTHQRPTGSAQGRTAANSGASPDPWSAPAFYTTRCVLQGPSKGVIGLLQTLFPRQSRRRGRRTTSGDYDARDDDPPVNTRVNSQRTSLSAFGSAACGKTSETKQLESYASVCQNSRRRQRPPSLPEVALPPRARCGLSGAGARGRRLLRCLLDISSRHADGK